MRLHILSDLHLEFGPMPRDFEPPPCDVVILAGDIWKTAHGVTWAGETFKTPVIYVPGNHEFYGRHKITPTVARMKEVAAPHVHVLDDDAYIIGGVNFIGATLWTDFNLYGTPEVSAAVARQCMNDFRIIEREPYGPLRPSDTVERHQASRRAIDTYLDLMLTGKTVVVTHHLPSEQSVAPRFRGDSLSPAFASNLEDTILRHRPELWVHGHTHDSADYMIDRTRVVCNPRGYAGEELNPQFDQHLVVDIDA